MKIDIKLLIIIIFFVYFSIKNKASNKNELIEKTLIFSGLFYLILNYLNISCNKNIEGFGFIGKVWHYITHQATKTYNKAKKAVKKTVTHDYKKVKKTAKKYYKNGKKEILKESKKLDKDLENIKIPILNGKILNLNLGPEFNKLDNEAKKKIKSAVTTSVTSIAKFSKKVGKDIHSVESNTKSILKKVGNKISSAEKDFLKNLTNPCWWLNGDACVIATTSATIGLSTILSEGTSEIEAEMLVSMQAIKSALKGVAEGSMKRISLNIIDSALVPILQPIFELILDVIYPSWKKIKSANIKLNNASSVIGQILTDVLLNEILDGETGLTFTWLVAKFVSAFICTGSLFDLDLSDYIEDFKPLIKLGEEKAGLKC